jgi:hypothetical protein
VATSDASQRPEGADQPAQTCQTCGKPEIDGSGEHHEPYEATCRESGATCHTFVPPPAVLTEAGGPTLMCAPIAEGDEPHRYVPDGLAASGRPRCAGIPGEPHHYVPAEPIETGGEEGPTCRISANEYGTPVSVHTCRSCGQEFTVCPPVDNEEWGGACLGETCASYDLRRDANLLLFPEEIGESQ